MSDLVEKLRAVDVMTGHCNPYCCEAADEIERLQARCAELETALLHESTVLQGTSHD